MAHILVTGGGGYIGAVMVGMLLEQGHKVTALDRFFFGEQTLAEYAHSKNLRVVKKDIRDVEIGDLEGADGVFDLAALSNDPSGDLDPKLTEAINLDGRAHVALTAKRAGVKRYILSSSCSVYGTGKSTSLVEDAPTSPITTYAKSSLAAEQAALPLADDRFTVSVLRNATVFGLSPRMRFDLVVNLMTLHAVQKGKIMVLGGGKQWRPLVHIQDVTAGFMSVFEAPQEKINGEVFNLGLANHQVLSLAYMVRETLPFPIEIDVAPDDADKRDYNVSFDKMRQKLGFTPRMNVQDGIREVYEALKGGRTEFTPRTTTVEWYRRIIEADELVRAVRLNDRLI
jgi:nucleoside-diphosphate-sugar epimerase